MLYCVLIIHTNKNIIICIDIQRHVKVQYKKNSNFKNANNKTKERGRKT